MMIRSASKLQPFGNRDERNQVRKPIDGADNARSLFNGWGPKL
jgi:hypothetical protein